MNTNNHSRSRSRLQVERLEQRDVPASFGVPWNDGAHLTLSFVPDGTEVSTGLTSSLHTALDSQLPRDTWRGAIIQAARTWSEWANINIGIVEDSGAAFGIAGQMQHDPRFGDIRIGAVPMAADAWGQAVPPDPLLVGTFAGDLFFNTNTTYTAERLYRVALHELGHALGLPPSTDARSIMFNQYNGQGAITHNDVLRLRAMYGVKVADANEGSGSNNVPARATAVPMPSGYDGETPLVAWGELSSTRDVDFFRFTNVTDEAGPITVQVHTAGLSLMVPRLSVYDQRMKLLGTVSATAVEGDHVQLTIPNAPVGARYFLRVDDAVLNVGNTGRYGIAITFDQELETPAINIADVLRGPYEQLDADDLEELFDDPNISLFNDDDDDDDDFAEADTLRATTWAVNKASYHFTASIDSDLDEDYYRLRAPATTAGKRVTLTVYANAIGANGTTPKVQLFDDHENPLSVDVLVNGAGRYTVQAANLPANRRYRLQLANAEVVGNYSVEAIFGTQAANVPVFSESTLDATSRVAGSLYVARTQLFAFSLRADAPGSSVTMTITNGGTTVFTLTANNGDTASAISTFLAPGEYQVTITATGNTTYLLRGAVQSDPIGPQPSNSTFAPMYPHPTMPLVYLYPTGQMTVDPFLFALTLLR